MLLRDADVFHGAGQRVFGTALGARKQIGQHLAPGQRGEGQRRDELLRGVSQDCLHREAVLHQSASQLRRLVSGYTTANAERYIHRPK